MSYLVARTDLFKYFSDQLAVGDWGGKNVLDFGGSDGGLLRDPDTTIEQGRYSCIDVVEEAIARGRADYPNAHWHFYNRYSFYYNSRGIKDLEIPDPGQRFDIIATYSVFTSMGPGEIANLVPQLLGLLAPKGILAFTFIDPHFHSWPDRYGGNNLQWRLERLRAEGVVIDIPEMLARAHGASCCTLLKGTDLFVDEDSIPTYPENEQESCHVYHTAELMKRLFPAATVTAPANNEMQHCCLLSPA